MTSSLAVFIPLAASIAAGPPLPEALGELTVLVTPADYPREALGLRQQGDTTVELLINATGRVTGCSILVSSGSPSLDAATCKVMKSRGRFKFAKDANGKHVTSVVRQRMAWRLPDIRPKDTPLYRAFVHWAACLRAESSKLARTDLTVSEIERKAFAACSVQEGIMAPHLDQAAGHEADFPATLDELKNQYRAWIAGWVTQVRGLP